MDIVRAQTPEVQALWDSVPKSLYMDVLDILHSNLSDDAKVAAVRAATSVQSQEAFIPYNPLIKDARDAANDAAEALLYKPEVSKLNFLCVYCKSKNTVVVSTQTRSADEATPVRIVCLACKKMSVERG